MFKGLADPLNPDIRPLSTAESSMSDNAIADVMEAYANDAVAYAKNRFNITLDFSEQSLEDVDRILAEYQKSGIVVPEDLTDAEREELWIYCKMLGGYVGEVIIRNIGAEWQTKELDRGAKSVRLRTSTGVEGSPPDSVWRTLTEPYKGIVSYYRGLKVLLGHGDERTEDGVRTVQLPPLSSQPPGKTEKRPWWKLW